MRVSTRTHGLVDYLLALSLVAAPWLLGFGASGPAALVAVGVGLAVAANAVATDFELGRLRAIHVPVHLWIDGVLGLLLALSPWILGFDRTAWIPHVTAGVVLIGVALLTHTIPGYERRGSRGAAAP